MEIASSPLFEKTSRPFSLFLVYLALCLSLFAIDSQLQTLRNARQEVKSLLLPLQLVAVKTQNGLIRFFEGLMRASTLPTQMLALEQERAQLMKQIDEGQLIFAENETLRTLLNLPKRNEERWVFAEIVARQYAGQQQKTLLNKGHDQGIRLGLPVMTQHALYGQISQVFANYAEVRQINHRGMSVPVKIRGSTINGVVYGLGEERMELRHFSSRYTINVGDELVTSGLDGLFPPDLLVARVVAIAASSDEGGVRVQALPALDFSRERFVSIPTLQSAYGEWLASLPKQQDDKRKSGRISQPSTPSPNLPSTP